jgi:hypothetical protein
MPTLAIYHNSVPPGNKNPEKPEILTRFATGAKHCGDKVIDVTGHQCVPADVGVIQGWTHEVSARPHLQLRGAAIAQHPRVVAVDSNLFLYKDRANPGHYLRYSFNGIFPTTGIYCDTVIDPVRWQQIQCDLKLTVRDYRQQGHHVLLCLQRNGGWSMGDLAVSTWTHSVIQKLKQHTDRPIRIRPHPGDRSSAAYLGQFVGMSGVSISDPGCDMQHDLANCWAVINYNSSSVVGAAIEGYPVFVTDADRSQCKDIANTDLAMIETPQLPDRLSWLQRISMFHWKFDELSSGACWAHMRHWV